MPISLSSFCAALALVVTPVTVAFADRGGVRAEHWNVRSASGLPNVAVERRAAPPGRIPSSPQITTPAGEAAGAGDVAPSGDVAEPVRKSLEEAINPTVEGVVETVEGALNDVPGVDEPSVEVPSVSVPPAGQDSSEPAPSSPSTVRSPSTDRADSSAPRSPRGDKRAGSSVRRDRAAQRAGLAGVRRTNGSVSEPANATQEPVADGPVADILKSAPAAAKTNDIDEPSPITRIIELVPQRYRIAIAVLATLCLLLAAVLIRERMRTMRAEQDAKTDPLTGMMNRRAFDELLAEEWNRAQRYDRPLSILFLDVDQFKQFNDSKGHLAGDELLQRLAGKLTEQLRSFDAAARLGGDEFVVICPETDEDGAKQAARRLASQFNDLPVRVSIGSASRREGEIALSQLMARADRQMYKAKAVASAH